MRLFVFEVSEYVVHVAGREGGLLQTDCIDDPNYLSPCTHVLWELPQQLSSKEFTCNAGSIRDMVSIPGSERSPEEGMSTHSRVLAWRIPRTEEPGGLQSMGWQRIGHD